MVILPGQSPLTQDSSYDRETYVDISDSQSDFHNYTIVWTEESITWMVDGSTVRTLAYASALNGENYPQTPMRIKLGIWAGGDSSNSEGTIEWAGGETDYDDGPFTAYVKSVSITNYNPASSYTYGDETGSYSSIVLNDSNSTSSSTETTTSSTQTSGTILFFPRGFIMFIEENSIRFVCFLFFCFCFLCFSFSNARNQDLRTGP